MGEPVRLPAREQIPTEVQLTKDDLTAPRFTPRELETIREKMGRAMGEVLTDQTTDEKWMLLAWLKLRRQGFDVSWDQMLDVVIEVNPEVSVMDPTSDELSSGSRGSVGSGE